MQQTLATRRGATGPLLAFGVFATVVYAVALTVLAGPHHADLVAVAVTIDLVLVVPAAWAVLLVRGRGWPAASLLPVFVISYGLASRIVPPDGRTALDVIAYAVVGAELAIAGLIVHRVARAGRTLRAASGPDVLERFRAAAQTLIGRRSRAADVIAYESALLWYALFSWRSRPAPRPDPLHVHPGHARSGYGGIVAGLLLVLAVEVVAVHVLVATWSTALAWVLTIVSAYGGLWLVGDYRALRARATTLDSSLLRARLGLRWDIHIPRADIASIRPLPPGETAAADLRMTVPNAPRVLIRLRRPAEAVGIYGLRRRVGTVELAVDEPDRLVAALGATG